MYVLAHILSTFLLILSLWAIGGVFVHRHDGDVLLRFALGSMVATGLLFTMATVGLYRPLSILVGVALLAGLGAFLGRSARSQSRATGSRATGSRATGSRATGPSGADPKPGFAAGTLLVVFGVCCLALLVEALKPTISWDADVYHLTVPKLYLEEGGFFRVPFNVYSNWPLNIELLYGLALVRAPVVAKALHLVFGIAASLVAYRLARHSSTRSDSPRIGNRFCGAVAMVLFLGNPVVLRQVATAYVDCAYAFFFGLAAFLLLEVIEDSSVDTGRARGKGPADPRLYLVGLLAGMAAGIKLNGFFAAFCLSCLCLVGLERRRLRSALTIALVAFATLAPWLIKSWVLTGNPVYPMLFSVFGGPEWSDLLADKHAAWQRSIGMGRSLSDYLLLPMRIVLNGGEGYGNFDGALSPVWLTFLPLSLFGLLRDRRTRLMLLLPAVYFVLWALTSQQMRFLIPILPFLAAAAARSLLEIFSLVTRALESELRKKVLVGLEIVLALSLSGQLLSESWPLLKQAPRISRDLFVMGPELDARLTHPIYGFMNQDLPEDAVVLMVNHNRGFALDRAFLADSFFEASQVEAALGWQTTRSEVRTTLAELGVTHLLVQNLERGLRFAEPLVEMLADPSAAKVIYRSPDGRYTVVELLDLRPLG